jgi:hypothetical protein
MGGGKEFDEHSGRTAGACSKKAKEMRGVEQKLKRIKEAVVEVSAATAKEATTLRSPNKRKKTFDFDWITNASNGPVQQWQKLRPLKASIVEDRGNQRQQPPRTRAWR